MCWKFEKKLAVPFLLELDMKSIWRTVISSRVLILLALGAHCVQGANVLIILPLYTGSHGIILESFGEYMMTRGHNVTMIKFQDANRPRVESKINIVDLKVQDGQGYCSSYLDSEGRVDIGKKVSKVLWQNTGTVGLARPEVFKCAPVVCDSILGDKELFERMEESEFDVALVDMAFNFCGMVFAKALDLPITTFWVPRFSLFETLLTPMPNLPSVVPGACTGLPAKMNFLQRVENFLTTLVHGFFLEVGLILCQRSVDAHYPNMTHRIRDIVREGVSMHFSVQNHLTTDPMVTLPNLFYIGGPHLREGLPIPEVS